jgi:hypothetical protein
MKYLVLLISLLLASCHIHEAKERIHGVTPLMKAAEKGDLALVQQLVEGGADLDAKDSKGCTVFMRVGGMIARSPEKMKESREFLLTRPGMDEEGLDEIIRASDTQQSRILINSVP